MFGKLKEMKEQMDMLNSLQSGMGNMDMSNPEAMLESMGINVEDIENHFNQINFNGEFEKIPLNFINDSENSNPEYAYESDS